MRFWLDKFSGTWYISCNENKITRRKMKQFFNNMNSIILITVAVIIGCGMAGCCC